MVPNQTGMLEADACQVVGTRASVLYDLVIFGVDAEGYKTWEFFGLS